MKLAIKNSMALLALISLASCGGGGGSAGGNGGSSKSPIKTRTSADNLKHLENWKLKPFKYCDLDDAFGLEDSYRTLEELRYQSPALDVKLLFASNNDSAVFSDGSESVAISRYVPLSGTSTYTDFSDFDARIERYGSTCKIIIDGEEVFETILAEKLVISNHWGDKKPIDNSGKEDAIKKSIKTTEASVNFLGQVLKLTEEESKKYIIAINNIKDEVLYRVSEDYTWNSLPNMAEDYSIEVRTPAIAVQDDHGNTLNHKDVGNHVFKYNVKAGTLAGVNFLKYLGTVPHDVNEASLCLKMMDANVVALHNMFRRCELLEPQIRKLAMENGVMLALTLKYFSSTQLETNSHSFKSFKATLKTLVKLQLLSGGLVRELDPFFETSIVTIIANSLKSIDEQTTKHPELLAVKDSLIEIALEWAFQDTETNGMDLQELLSVAKAFKYPLNLSINGTITDLAQNLNFKRFVVALKFAHDLPTKGVYTEKVLEYIKRQYPVGVSRDNFLRTIFTNQVTHQDLDNWLR